MGDSKDNAVMEWNIESTEVTRDAVFVDRGASTKVVPVSSGASKMAPTSMEHSAAVIKDIDMETAFMERDTDGFHYQRNKGMRKNQAGSRMVGGKRPNNPDVYKSFESEEYVIPDTAQQEATFMNDTKYKTKRRYYCLWALYFAIGISVSLCVAGALYVCGKIEKTRVKATQKYLVKGDLMFAWITWTGSSVAMCVFAALICCYQPACTSSGIPGLIAYLNGVKPLGGKSHFTGKMTSFVSVKTMLFKLVGMVASIPSGLAIGPEGPIIHISALLAFWTATLFQHIDDKYINRTHGTRLESSKNHMGKSEQRDFLATGAACGICTAFRAPLAGTLFVVEEAASFFTTRHLEFTFFACLAAYWCQWILGYELSGEDAALSKFLQVTGFFCNLDTPLDMLFYAGIAVIGGWMGALFNHIVEHWNHIRGHHTNKHGWMRVLEVFILATVTGTVVIFLPMLSNCRIQDRSLMLRDSAGCLNEKDIFQLSHGNIDLDYARLITANATNTSNYEAWKLGQVLEAEAGDVGKHDGHIMLDNLDTNGKYIHLHYEHAYTCSGGHDFNDMAMLWLNGGVKGVKVLLQRGFPHMLSPLTLALFCAVYFILAALTAGASVPAGLVVPMLLIGGSMGRLVGLGALEFHKMLCTDYSALEGDDMYNVYHWSAHFRWMIRDCRLPDPGTFAVIGMASFMGGSGRITVMLATVILELTADAGLIAPVGITCVIAMLVGNLFNHGLYHGLIPLMNIPFLNSAPAPIMYVSRIRDIMSEKLVWLPCQVHIGELKTLMARCEKGHVTHNAFPVVVSTENLLLQGLITKEQIELAIEDFKDEKRKNIIQVQCGTGNDKISKIDLMHYCDRGPLTVNPHTTVARAYSVFRKLGLRHLPVVHRNGMVAGMITRKSLMVFKLVECHEREIQLVKWIQQKVRDNAAKKSKLSA